MRLDHLLSKELLFFARSCGSLFVWLSRRVCDCHGSIFAGWRHTFKVMVASSGWWCGWAEKGLCAHVVLGLGGHTGLRDKRVCVGALLGVWGSTRLFLLGPCVDRPLCCGWLCVGVVLCENCIVDASIFLFCVLVFVP